MSELSYKELRKGNLLYFPFISGNIEVIGVNALYGVKEPYFNKLSVIEGINMYYEPIEVFKPIPLSEEWLIKFGFKKTAEGFLGIKIKKKCFLELNLKTKRTIIIRNDDFLDIIFNNELHQLQNLYFAITGKELTHQKIN